MTRLLVDEGGVRRSFKVGDGVLTIGAGEGAALRLSSPDVADEHAELDVRGKRVFLRARPGVQAPKVGGEPIAGETELDPGAEIEIGSAGIRVEFEGEPGRARAGSVAPGSRGPASSGPAADRPRPVKSRAKSKSKSGGARTSSKGARKSRPQAASSRRSKAREKQKRKSLVSLAIFVGILVGIGIFARFVVPAMFGETAVSFEPLAQYNRARNAYDAGRLEEALAELDDMPADAEPSERLLAQIADLREVIEQVLASRRERAHNDLGDEFLRSQLKQFEQEYLLGKPEAPAVRVFLRRAAEFEQRWPDHPELDWVRRLEERYSANTSLSAPATFEDVKFEVRLLNRSDPRDYGAMLQLLEQFMGSAGPGARERAAELFDEKVAERQAWYEEKLELARSEYENGEHGQSVEWLVRIVVFTGDPVMSAEGATRLLRFPDIDERLRGYRRTYPEKFERLAQHPLIRDYLVTSPLE